QRLDRLRLRRERPRRRRAAEKRDELAPFHSLMPPVLRTKKIAHLGPAGGAVLRDFDRAYDRSGSKPAVRGMSSASPLHLNEPTSMAAIFAAGSANSDHGPPFRTAVMEHREGSPTLA